MVLKSVIENFYLLFNNRSGIKKKYVYNLVDVLKIIIFFDKNNLNNKVILKYFRKLYHKARKNVISYNPSMSTFFISFDWKISNP